jgi:hypothetical protein
MPRSRNHKTYPAAYHELVQQAATRQIVIPCGTEAAARTMRGHLYGFHSALERATHEKDCPPETRALRHITTTIEYRVEGPNLIARPNDMNPQVKLLRSVLDSLPSAPAASGGDSAVTQPPASLLELMRKAADE